MLQYLKVLAGGAAALGVYESIVSERTIITYRRRPLLFPLWYEISYGNLEFSKQKDGVVLANHGKHKMLVDDWMKLKTVGTRKILSHEEHAHGVHAMKTASRVFQYLSHAKCLIVESEVINYNASSYPGGNTYCGSGVFNLLKDEEVRFVLCHEIAHSVLRHENELMFYKAVRDSVKCITIAKGFLECLLRLTPSSRFMGFALYVSIAKIWESLFNAFVFFPSQRRNEYEADFVGLLFHKACGWKDDTLLAGMKKIIFKDELRLNFWKMTSATHPPSTKRFEKMQQYISQSESEGRTDGDGFGGQEEDPKSRLDVLRYKDMEDNLNQNENVMDEEKEYVLLDLDAVCSNMDIPPNAPYVLSDMEDNLNQNENVMDEEKEYVLLDLDAVCSNMDIPPNAPYVLSVGEYEETIGTCYVFNETESVPLVPEETGPSEADLFRGKCIVDPFHAAEKQLNPFASLQKILKFRFAV